MTSSVPRPSRFGADLVTSYLAGGLSLVSGVILLPVAAGTIGLEVYGTWLALSAIQQLVFAIDLGAGTTLVRFSAAAGKDGPLPLPAVWALGRRAVAALGVLQLLAYLAVALLARAAGGFDVGNLSLFGLGLGIFLVGVPLRLALHVLQGTGHYSTASLHLIAGTLLGQSLKIVAMVTGAPDVILWLAVGDVVTVALPSVMAWSRLRRLVDFPLLGRVDTGRGRPLRSRDVLSFAFNNAALLTSGAVILHSSTLFVGLLLSPSSVALYDAAVKTFQGGRRLLDMVMGPLLPWTTHRLGPGGAARDAASIFRRLWRCAVLPLSLALTGLFFAAPWLVEAWLGPGFADAVVPVQILVAVLVLQTFLVPGLVLRQAANRLATFTLLNVGWMAASLALAVPLVRTVGLNGAPLAVLLPLLALLVPLLLADAGRLFGQDRSVPLLECGRTLVVLAATAASAQLLLSGRLLAAAAGVLLLSGCFAISAVLIRNAISRARGAVSPV